MCSLVTFFWAAYDICGGWSTRNISLSSWKLSLTVISCYRKPVSEQIIKWTDKEMSQTFCWSPQKCHVIHIDYIRATIIIVVMMMMESASVIQIDTNHIVFIGMVSNPKHCDWLAKVRMAAQSHDRVTCIKLSRLKIYVSWIEKCNILTSKSGRKSIENGKFSCRANCCHRRCS